MTTLWRHRGFLHLWGAQATSAFGTRIGREAIALSAVILLGSGPLDLAWLNLAVSLPYLLFGLAAGILIDRMRRRPLLIATDLVRAGLLATIPIAAWLGAFSLAQLLIVVFLVIADLRCRASDLCPDPDRETLAARCQCQAGIDVRCLGDRRTADRRRAGAGAGRADRDPVRCDQLHRVRTPALASAAYRGAAR
jgi:Transmembrane secretion effector